jgi:hypothetical protein
MAAGKSLGSSGEPRLRRADVEIDGNPHPTSRAVVRLPGFYHTLRGAVIRANPQGGLIRRNILICIKALFLRACHD